MSVTSPVESPWLLLTATLPGRSGTPRVRLWRGLRELGAAALRDGVYLLPDAPAARDGFATLGAEIADAGGETLLLAVGPQPGDRQAELVGRFDRSGEYASLVEQARAAQQRLPTETEAPARRTLRGLLRELAAVEAVDFFPASPRDAAREVIAALATAIDARFAPGEPVPAAGAVPRLDATLHRGRTWATRRRLWVDRVASAWLIRRFIDPEARFRWLDSPADCPADVLGFDFDGATFTHVGDKVTFEVLLASFGLDTDAGLVRLGQLVHYLDAGGLPVAEAPGFEAVLAGLRDAAPDDDALLAAATPLLDALCRTFTHATA